MSELRFTPEQLKPDERKPGISAVMRLRNSEDFLEDVIVGHAPFFDEIVAVHNQCTDTTLEILEAMQKRFPGKLAVFHYEPRVHPSGSEEHLLTPATSVHSLINYSNFALARSTRRIVTLLDDDHIAISSQVERLTRDIRQLGSLGRQMWCFSGLNLDLSDTGEPGIRAAAPFSGNGDHGYFEVTPRTYFEHDRKFERLRYQELDRRYHGLAYWHMKYLKKGHGFSNYELEDHPRSRYRRHRQRFLDDRTTLPIEPFITTPRRGHSLTACLSLLPLPDRLRLKLARHATLHLQLQGADLIELGRVLDRISRRRADL